MSRFVPHLFRSALLQYVRASRDDVLSAIKKSVVAKFAGAYGTGLAAIASSEQELLDRLDPILESLYSIDALCVVF